MRSYFPGSNLERWIARPRSRAIPPTPRPRGRLSVLALQAPGQWRRAEVPRVRSWADYDGGARQGARLTRLLAGRERRCRPRRGCRAGSHASSQRRSSNRSSRRVRGGGSEERLTAARERRLAAAGACHRRGVDVQRRSNAKGRSWVRSRVLRDGVGRVGAVIRTRSGPANARSRRLHRPRRGRRAGRTRRASAGVRAVRRGGRGRAGEIGANSRPGSQVGREGGVAPSSTSCRIARKARRGRVVSGRCSPRLCPSESGSISKDLRRLLSPVGSRPLPYLRPR